VSLGGRKDVLEIVLHKGYGFSEAIAIQFQ
jgi:hypothetical protein